MPYYAQIDGHNVCIGVSELSAPISQSNLIPLASLDAGVLGKVWNGHGWDAVVDDTSTVYLTLSADTITAGESVNWTATLRTPAGQVQPYTQTYYVPVFRQDGWQVTLIPVPLVDGQASGSVQIDLPGIYTLDLSQARPVPTARLGVSPELIVIPA